MGNWNQKLLQASYILVGRLKMQNKRIALAESCTGGLAASSLVGIDGASDVLTGGIVAYTPQAKNRWLGVRKGTMKKYGLVSRQTAAQMAKGALKISGADYALSFTGLAGTADNKKRLNAPLVSESRKKMIRLIKKDADALKPVGLVYVGLAEKKGKKVYVRELHLSGSRNKIRKKAVFNGFNMLLSVDVRR